MSKKKEYIWDDIEVEEDESFEQFKEVKDPDESEEESNDGKKRKDKKKQVKTDRKIPYKTLAVVVVIFVFVVLFVSPLIGLNSISVNNMYFNTKENVVSTLNIKEGERISLLKLIALNFELSYDAMIDYHLDYNFSEQTLSIHVNEIKPLAYSQNQMYYYDGSEILKSELIKYDAPNIINTDSNLTQHVLEQLSKLDYEDIKLIDEIQANTNVINSELLLIKMNDGNLVEINISQMQEKLPYYEQIANIIKANGSKPGIIHLNIGDYYEPN